MHQQKSNDCEYFEQRSNNCSSEGPYTSVMLSGQLPSRSLTTAASLLFKASFQPCNTFIASMNTLVSDTPSSLSTEGIRGRSLTTVPCPYGDLTACRSLTTAQDTSFDAIWRPSPRRSLYDCGIGGTSVVLQLTSHGQESNNCPFPQPGAGCTLRRRRETSLCSRSFCSVSYACPLQALPIHLI